MSLGRDKADRRNPALGEVHDNAAFLPIPAGKPDYWVTTRQSSPLPFNFAQAC
jgi:hypothetical protein